MFVRNNERGNDMSYKVSKSAVKGRDELIVMVVSSVIASKLVPLAQTVGIDIDPIILTGAILTGLATLSRVIGNWWKHRKDGK
jgi:hypothetical protein